MKIFMALIIGVFIGGSMGNAAEGNYELSLMFLNFAVFAVYVRAILPD